jgi:GNAT superfamily N-acetyltransferase
VTIAPLVRTVRRANQSEDAPIVRHHDKHSGHLSPSTRQQLRGAAALIAEGLRRARVTGIRDARRDDAPRIATLLAELGYPTATEEVARRLDDLTAADAILLTGDGLIALHRIPRIAEGGAFARITALVVADGARGRGVAGTLLAAAEDRARRWGCDLIEVSSGRRPERAPAHAFYRAAGFADTGERSTRYWKRLGAP